MLKARSERLEFFLKIHKIVLLILFLLSPFISASFTFIFYLKRPNDTYYKLILVVFMSLVALTIIPAPTADITRYYLKFKEIEQISFQEIIFSLNKGTDWLIYIYFKLVSYFTSNHQWIGFFSAFFNYLFLFQYISEIIKENDLKHPYPYIILFIGLQSLYSWAGMRQPNAIICFLFGIYLNLEKKKSAYIYMILAPLFHASLYIPVCIYIFSKFFRYKRKYVFFSFISVIIIFFGKVHLINFIEHILALIAPSSIQYKFRTYISNPELTGTLMLTLVFSRIISLFNMLIFYYFNFSKRIEGKKIKILCNFLLIYYVFLSITSLSSTMLGRYFSVISYVVFFTNIYFIENKIEMQLRKKIRIIYLTFGILGWLNNITYDFPSYNYKLVYSNLYQILNTEVPIEQYDDVQKFYNFLRKLAGYEKNNLGE